MREARGAGGPRDNLNATGHDPIHAKIALRVDRADLERCDIESLELASASLPSKFGDPLVELDIDSIVVELYKGSARKGCDIPVIRSRDLYARFGGEGIGGSSSTLGLLLTGTPFSFTFPVVGFNLPAKIESAFRANPFGHQRQSHG